MSNGSVNSETIFGVKRQSFHCLWGIVKPQKGEEYVGKFVYVGCKKALGNTCWIWLGPTKNVFIKNNDFFSVTEGIVK